MVGECAGVCREADTFGMLLLFPKTGGLHVHLFLIYVSDTLGSVVGTVRQVFLHSVLRRGRRCWACWVAACRCCCCVRHRPRRRASWVILGLVLTTVCGLLVVRRRRCVHGVRLVGLCEWLWISGYSDNPDIWRYLVLNYPYLPGLLRPAFYIVGR